MAETKIEWTDYTFNAWWGCTKISPGCANCYAEKWDHRHGGKNWGKDAPRRFFGEKHWNQPRIWAKEAARKGRIYRVFSNSMSDMFERYEPIQNIADGDALESQRAKHFRLIEDTKDNLIWLLLTKRIENVRDMIPRRWIETWPKNVMIGFTAENRTMLDQRWKIWRRDLFPIPGVKTFISAEPLLEPLTGPAREEAIGLYHALILGGIDWVIAGGESGPGARPAPPDWFRDIRNACEEAGTPFLFKQWGNWSPWPNGKSGTHTKAGYNKAQFVPIGNGEHHRMFPAPKAATGRLLDGVEHNEFPKHWPQNLGIIHQENPLKVLD